MFVKTVLARFFKSFNFDYLRKNHAEAKPLPWENIGNAWFPFVRIPLAKEITTIVGANESGKSHSLSAIIKALTGEGIARRDFCRYSQFFTVEEGNMRWPDFGLHFAELNTKEQEELRTLIEVKPGCSSNEFVLIRKDKSVLDVWLKKGEEYVEHAVSDPSRFTSSSLLPKVFQIDSSVALPSSVPLSWLRGETQFPWHRSARNSLVIAIDKLLSHFDTAENVKQGAAAISTAMSPFRSKGSGGDADSKSLALARDLIFTVAKIDKSAIADLSKALADEDEGLANGLLQQINQRLASALNFPKWWVQDRDFRLTVSARDDDLVFTVSDRTHTEYSFGERSNGLKYFLSYYVQYLAHKSPANRHEILLMDEPDAYLSSQGQQDLLKIFNSFAQPEDKREPIQVVYVTHSPFLIDRNHGERIRVLEKGTDDEGTRVVNDASKNHYEPLRSSFGAFVGETAFIGNCNLFVEGLADQVLLAGCTAYLRATDVPKINTLDLNRLTIVPAGSASHIPYLVYLARGRDIEQPSVIVLLDNDEAGKTAEKGLRNGGPKHKPLIKSEYILMLSALNADMTLPTGRTLVETEDLIPPHVAALATQQYLHKVCGITRTRAELLTGEAILSAWEDGQQHFDAICHTVQSVIGDEFHVDKMGFAREVVALIQQHHTTGESGIAAEDVAIFKQNFGVLLRKLAEMQRKAERDTSQDRISRRIDRSIKSFLNDHDSSAKREEAILLLEDIESALDDSEEADIVRTALQKLKRDHDLAEPKPGNIDNYESFTAALSSARYAARNAVQAEVVDLSQTVAVQQPKSSPPVAKALEVKPSDSNGSSESEPPIPDTVAPAT